MRDTLLLLPQNLLQELSLNIPFFQLRFSFLFPLPIPFLFLSHLPFFFHFLFFFLLYIPSHSASRTVAASRNTIKLKHTLELNKNNWCFVERSLLVWVSRFSIMSEQFGLQSVFPSTYCIVVWVGHYAVETCWMLISVQAAPTLSFFQTVKKKELLELRKNRCAIFSGPRYRFRLFGRPITWCWTCSFECSIILSSLCSSFCLERTYD